MLGLIKTVLWVTGRCIWCILYILYSCFHAANKYVLPAVLLLVTLYQYT